MFKIEFSFCEKEAKTYLKILYNLRELYQKSFVNGLDAIRYLNENINIILYEIMLTCNDSKIKNQLKTVFLHEVNDLIFDQKTKADYFQQKFLEKFLQEYPKIKEDKTFDPIYIDRWIPSHNLNNKVWDLAEEIAKIGFMQNGKDDHNWEKYCEACIYETLKQDIWYTISSNKFYEKCKKFGFPVTSSFDQAKKIDFYKIHQLMGEITLEKRITILNKDNKKLEDDTKITAWYSYPGKPDLKLVKFTEPLKHICLPTEDDLVIGVLKILENYILEDISIEIDAVTINTDTIKIKYCGDESTIVLYEKHFVVAGNDYAAYYDEMLQFVLFQNELNIFIEIS